MSGADQGRARRARLYSTLGAEQRLAVIEEFATSDRSLGQLDIAAERPVPSVTFVRSRNAARSQLAAAFGRDRSDEDATSASTDPTVRIHPGAIAAAEQAGLDLTRARTRLLEPSLAPRTTVVTVCDLAHEELRPRPERWHWSIPDPVLAGTDAAFYAVVSRLNERIKAIA